MDQHTCSFYKLCRIHSQSFHRSLLLCIFCTDPPGILVDTCSQAYHYNQYRWHTLHKHLPDSHLSYKRHKDPLYIHRDTCTQLNFQILYSLHHDHRKPVCTGRTHSAHTRHHYTQQDMNTQLDFLDLYTGHGCRMERLNRGPACNHGKGLQSIHWDSYR